MVHYDHEKKQENIKQRGHHDILYTHIQSEDTLQTEATFTKCKDPNAISESQKI